MSEDHQPIEAILRRFRDQQRRAEDWTRNRSGLPVVRGLLSHQDDRILRDGKLLLDCNRLRPSGDRRRGGWHNPKPKFSPVPAPQNVIRPYRHCSQRVFQSTQPSPPSGGFSFVDLWRLADGRIGELFVQIAVSNKEPEGTTMWSRYALAAALGCGIASNACAEPLTHRVSCAVVRFYVAKYSAPAAEAWARNNGATEIEIESARRCIRDAPVQNAQLSRAALN